MNAEDSIPFDEAAYVPIPPIHQALMVPPAQLEMLTFAEFWRTLMKFEIASIEAPEFVLGPGYVQTEQYHPQYETIQDKTFEGGWVVVDNRHFQNCKFVRAHLVYSGGMFGFRDCEIDAESVLSLTGSAARAVALWKAFVQHPERKPFPF